MWDCFKVHFVTIKYFKSPPATPHLISRNSFMSWILWIPNNELAILIHFLFLSGHSPNPFISIKLCIPHSFNPRSSANLFERIHLCFLLPSTTHRSPPTFLPWRKNSTLPQWRRVLSPRQPLDRFLSSMDIYILDMFSDLAAVETAGNPSPQPF